MCDLALNEGPICAGAERPVKRRSSPLWPGALPASFLKLGVQKGVETSGDLRFAWLFIS